MDLLLGLALVVILGGLGQWIAWRLNLPSILILLLLGFLAGPVFGFIQPDAYFGETLFPAISLIVGLILFEGGLTLNFRELKAAGRAIRNLISIGVLVSWALATVLAIWVLQFPTYLALIFGAVLTVTGPTVIAPLLRLVRPVGRVGHVLKWEGIIIDPIGVLLAVLVFEAVLAGAIQQVPVYIAMGVLKTLFGGLFCGALGAALVILMVRKHWLPDYLLNSFTLAVVSAVFVMSHAIQHEAGLFATTVMGITLANQRVVPVKKIHEFKTHLGLMLIASLFIILSARIDIAALEHLGWRSMAFVALLVFCVRPLAVWLSTIGLQFTRAERIFMMAMAPRGVVAIAVTSVFAYRLEEKGFYGATAMLPEMLFLVFTTVAIYGLAALPIGRILGLSRKDPQGVLIIGGSYWVRDMAKELLKHGVEVSLVDNNAGNVNSAKKDGINAVQMDVVAEDFLDEIEVGGIGRALVLTPNDEVNSLASLRLMEVFGHNNVYQIPPESSQNRQYYKDGDYVRGRFLFTPEATFYELSKRFSDGARIQKIQLEGEEPMEQLREAYGSRALPLFLYTTEKSVRIFNVRRRFEPKEGDEVLALVSEART